MEIKISLTVIKTQIKILMLDTSKVAALPSRWRERGTKVQDSFWLQLVSCQFDHLNGPDPLQALQASDPQVFLEGLKILLTPVQSIGSAFQFTLVQSSREGHEQLQVQLTFHFHNWGAELVFQRLSIFLTVSKRLLLCTHQQLATTVQKSGIQV